MNTFYMVFVEGCATPACKHESLDSAEKEAKRLATLLKKKAYVLCTIKSVEDTQYKIEDCRPSGSDLPFLIGTVMKQTVEEAAREYSNDCRNRQRHCEPYCIVDFISGSEWQSKQSPWISVKERLPEPNKLVLCRMVSNGTIVSGYIVVSSGRSPYVATDGGFEFEDWNGYECDMWMPIPSFDDILEANRDVLERIKEKGD